MNAFLASVDGYTSSPTFPSGVYPLEWPTNLALYSTDTTLAIRKVLFSDISLNRYEHFCRSAWLVLLVKNSPFAHLERALHPLITYSVPQLKSYLNALPPAKRQLVVSVSKKLFDELPDPDVEYLKYIPTYFRQTFSAQQLLALYTVLMVTPPDIIETYKLMNP